MIPLTNWFAMIIRVVWRIRGRWTKSRRVPCWISSPFEESSAWKENLYKLLFSTLFKRLAFAFPKISMWKSDENHQNVQRKCQEWFKNHHLLFKVFEVFIGYVNFIPSTDFSYNVSSLLSPILGVKPTGRLAQTSRQKSDDQTKWGYSELGVLPVLKIFGNKSQ